MIEARRYVGNQLDQDVRTEGRLFKDRSGMMIAFIAAVDLFRPLMLASKTDRYCFKHACMMHVCQRIDPNVIFSAADIAVRGEVQW